jgi:hypothetical protein
VRLTPPLAAAVVVALLAGCTSAPDPALPPPRPSASPPPWTEPAKYGFVLDRKCPDGPSLGRYRVTVANGAVVTADRIDGRTAEGEEEIEVPSLSRLLDLARTAGEDGGAVSTAVDPRDGHPTAVSFDVSDDGSASCFLITDYAPAS